MEREAVLRIVNLVLANNGKEATSDSDVTMRDAGFRSLDFSEVALRIEDELGSELNFEAAVMRRIATIRDVVDFFVDVARSDAQSV